MQTAVLTTEDSGFRRHGGFDMEAIRNSIRENLRSGKFTRGASTLSMQLAKNLYLDRGKTVSRKLQEVVLTTYLEQELTKDQILELYLNVIEFGPMVYGIGPAARYYFNTSATDLSLAQALYMSSILPNPKQQHFAVGGEVSPGWMNFLRKLMATAHKRQWITDEELEEGLKETVVRGQPAPKRADKPAEMAPTQEGDLERPTDF
jgi:membrane peptidoglycan carboxypeptidase